MSKTASFGRRRAATPRAVPAPKSDDIALTPEQRAALFDAPELSEINATSPMRQASARPPAARNATTVATLAVAVLVLALAIRLPRDGGDASAPLTLTETLLSISANLAASLWLTRMICAAFKWSALPAFAALGGGASLGLAVAAATLGLGDEISPPTAALAGAGAAALYRLIAGRRSFQ